MSVKEELDNGLLFQQSYYILATIHLTWSGILFILSGIFAVGGGWSIYVRRWPFISGFVLGALALLALASSIFLLLRNRSLQKNGPNPNLALRIVRHDYYFEGDKHVYVGVVRAKVLEAGLHSYIHKFEWAGFEKAKKEDIKLTPLTTNIRIMEHMPEACGPEHVCLVNLKDCSKRETIEFSYQIELKDSSRTTKPYLYHLTSAPVRLLQLRVRFPHDWQGQQYCRQRYTSFASDVRQKEWLESFKHNSAGSKKAYWDLKPQFGWKYQILWQGKDLKFPRQNNAPPPTTPLDDLSPQ